MVIKFSPISPNSSYSIHISHQSSHTDSQLKKFLTQKIPTAEGAGFNNSIQHYI